MRMIALLTLALCACAPASEPRVEATVGNDRASLYYDSDGHVDQRREPMCERRIDGQWREVPCGS